MHCSGTDGVRVSASHPAALLALWVGFAILLQPLFVVGLAVATSVMLPLALFGAGETTRKLLFRTRWLLLTIVVLFAFATPGERLPGSLGETGITWDGIHQGAEHVMRLVLLLAALALLHKRLGTDGIIAGLHWLLAPLARWRDLRQRIVVRLMLILDHVENTAPGSWRGWLMESDTAGVDRLTLSVRPTKLRDWLVFLGVAVMVLIIVFGS